VLFTCFILLSTSLHTTGFVKSGKPFRFPARFAQVNLKTLYEQIGIERERGERRDIMY